MSDDHSPGDRRQPYSDQGGPQGRHAQTHDVEREMQTNPTGPEPEDPTFAEQLSQDRTGVPRSHADESSLAVDDKRLHNQLPELSDSELAQLPVLQTGTRLDQGGSYLDLNRLGSGAFRALAGHEVSGNERIVSKRDTPYDIWNRLVGDQREPDIERPPAADQGDSAAG